MRTCRCQLHGVIVIPAIFENHFDDHKDDFGATSWNDYADQAQDFQQRIQDDNLPAVEGPDGVVRAYDPDSNTFGAYNADGTTRTFFQPDDGYDYFQEQIDKDVSTGGRIINPLPDESGGPENPPQFGTRIPTPAYGGAGYGEDVGEESGGHPRNILDPLEE